VSSTCPKCRYPISNTGFCINCGVPVTSQNSQIPGLASPPQLPNLNRPGTVVDADRKIELKKQFRKSYRIPLIAAVFFLVMDLFLNNSVESDHLVDNPWPFIFQISRILAFFTYLITLIVRSKGPMLFFIWAVTVALAVRDFAVIQRYGIEAVTLTEWVWNTLGLVVVSSFWILKYGVHNRLRNW
jgi:hypothetical protein